MSLWGSKGPIGLVAGAGDLPLVFTKAAKPLRPVVVFAIEGVTDERIEGQGTETVWIPWGELGRLFESVKSRKVKEIVLAGGIPKKRIYDPSQKLDDTARDFLGKTPSWTRACFSSRCSRPREC
jgi:DUF1009 family protein